MSTTTRQRGKQADQAKPQPRFAGIGNGVDLLLPEAAGCVPKPVRQASANALVAHQRWQELRTLFFAAEAEVRKAPRIDAAADQAAIAAGQPLPSERLLPAAQATLAEADRARSAARAAFLAAQRTLATEVSAELPTWLPAQREAVSTAHQHVQQALAQLAQSFERLQTEQRIAVTLEAWPEHGGNLGGVSFGHSPRQQQYADARRTQVEAEVRESATIGSMANFVPRDLDHLLGALALLADEGGVPQRRLTTTTLAS